MAGLVTATLDSVRSFTGSIAWAPLVRVSRAAILSLLTGLEVGQLTIRDKDGTETICGRPAAADGGEPWPTTQLTVVREAFWLRLALFADMVSWPAECR